MFSIDFLLIFFLSLKKTNQYFYVNKIYIFIVGYSPLTYLKNMLNVYCRYNLTALQYL